MTLEPPASAHTHEAAQNPALTAPHAAPPAAPPADAPPAEPPADAPPAEPQTRWQRIRGLVGMLAALAAGVLLLRQIDPHEPGVYPVCPTKVFTGVDCPGCGGLRATNELAHGDVAAAVDDNALVVLAVPLAAWLFGRAFYFAWTGRTPDPMPAKRARWITIAVIVVLTVFTVVRNLPGSFLVSG